MCTPLAQRLLGPALGIALAACGADLTLPDDRSPAQLRAVSGDGQEGTVGSRLERPLVVALTDASSRPVVGIPVEFRFQSVAPEAEVDPTSATTNEQGEASAEVRLGTSTGDLTVEARVVEASAELRATFGLTVLERGKGGKGKDKDDDDDDGD